MKKLSLTLLGALMALSTHSLAESLFPECSDPIELQDEVKEIAENTRGDFPAFLQALNDHERVNSHLECLKPQIDKIETYSQFTENPQVRFYIIIMDSIEEGFYEEILSEGEGSEEILKYLEDKNLSNGLMHMKNYFEFIGRLSTLSYRKTFGLKKKTKKNS